jgi:hypothetical protein
MFLRLNKNWYSILQDKVKNALTITHSGTELTVNIIKNNNS